MENSSFEAFKLCYIDGHQAYFTTWPLDRQWGDDWDDAPYEHNAGEPYAPGVNYYANGTAALQAHEWNADGTPKYQLLRVLFEASPEGANFVRPCDNVCNSPYSVQAINSQGIPWLTARAWNQSIKDYDNVGVLKAGASYPQFFEFIKKHGGIVYHPDTGLKPYPDPRPGLKLVTR